MNFFSNFVSKSLISVALLTLAAGFANPASATTKAGVSGNVRAEISYDRAGDFEYKNVRLKITRAGQTLFAGQVPRDSEYDRPIVDITEENTLPVVDLDGDKEPEIIVDLYTGGAHCCQYSLIYRYDKSTKKYTRIRHFWGNGGYVLRDFDKNGLLEFSSRDDRFAYAFDAYAASGYPPQIWQYRQGRMQDVTRRYPKIINSQATELWQTYIEQKKEGYELKGFLAAYLASKYLLGQGEDGWQKVRQAYQGGDRTKFFADVRRFLRETGYVR
jgi:hypothetical protein